jgi:hypothetical protein
VSGPRRIGELLEPGGSALSDLVRGARHRERLDTALREFVDRPLADHVQVASSHDGMLVLAADAPVWGHRTRYLAPAILEHLSQLEPDLREVRILVRPTAPDLAEPPPPRDVTLSERSASLLQTVARSCDNPALARILVRMGARRR